MRPKKNSTDLRELVAERNREVRIKELIELLHHEGIEIHINIERLAGPNQWRNHLNISWVSDEQEWWIRELMLTS